MLYEPCKDSVDSSLAWYQPQLCSSAGSHRRDKIHGNLLFLEAALFAPVSLLSVFVAAFYMDGTPAADSGMFRGTPEHLGVYTSPTTPAIGTVVWKFKSNAKILSTPLVQDETVYIASSDRNLYALNRTNGELRWKFDAGGPVSSSPAFLGGTVYINSLDGNLYALDAVTGSLKWKFTTGNVVHATPAVSKGVVYIGSWDRNMYALDAASGKELWRYQTGNDTTIYNQIGIASSAAVVAGKVFFGCRDGHFYALDAKTGKLVWSHDNKMGWVIASPAVRDNTVYFPTSDGKRFKALDASTGELKYSIENKNISFSSPAIVNDAVYFGSSDGWLHALDIATGKVRAEFQTDGSKANASKYIDEKGEMHNLFPNFTLEGMYVGLDRMFSLGSILSSPVVADGVLYVGSADGTLYALR